jgi:predicted branched-subunit amino acid permease
MLAGAKDVAPILLGIVPFGLVFGAGAIQAGLRPIDALGMSLLVNAGASQIASTSLFGQGAPFLVALGTGLVVNARMFIYSTSIAPVLSDASPRLRPLLGHMLVDQNYAVTMTRGQYLDDVDVVPYYMGSWFALASVWQLSTIAGALLGAFIPASWQLDFAVPLVFLAMLAPALKDTSSISVAVVTGIAAAVLVPLLPMQTGLLAAMLIGMVWGSFQPGPETNEEVAEELAEDELPS